MYHFKHAVIPNVCEESPKTAEILPPCGRQNDIYKGSLTILTRFASSQPVRCDIAAKLVDNKTLFCHSERM